MFSAMAAAALVEKKKALEKNKEEPIFECPICDGQFNRKYNRDRHMELIHKKPRPNLPPLFPELVNKDSTQKSEETRKPEESKKSEEMKQTMKTEEKSEEKKKPKVPKKPEAKSEETMEADKENIPPTIQEEKFCSKPTKICPESCHPIKKAKIVKEDSMDTNPPPNQSNPQVAKLPIQDVFIGRNAIPSLSVHFCGTCSYPNKHRYILLSNGGALVIIPVCEKCNDFNMRLSKTVHEFKKTLKD